MSQTLTYRPDIDGLRAIAVLAVIIYHLEIELSGGGLLAGGFIGVDVFFVISGYLITHIILKSLRENAFSFSIFYERRARRILPVLFVVILTTIPTALFLLLPQAMREFSNSVIATTFFSSNFLFFTEDSYWATPSSLKPLLHTWSLAVEEQYYVLAPILITLVWKYARKAMLGVFVLLVFSSLVFAHWMTLTNPDFSFFMLPTRLWEIGVGSILSQLEIRYSRKNSLVLSNLGAAIGLSLVVTSLVVFNEETLHPSLYTLVPIVGTALVIWFSNEQVFVTRVLSSKPFVLIGLLSYSLYLWHYPVFAFGKILDVDASLLSKGIWLGIAVALSVMTYFFVETPFRKKERVPKRVLIYTLTATASIVLALNIAMVMSNGFEQRFKELSTLYVENEFDNKLLQAESWTNEPAEVFYNEGLKKVLVVGDSHSKDMFNAFSLNSELFSEYEFSRLGLTVTRSDGVCVLDEPRTKSRFLSTEVYKNSDIVVISERFAALIVRRSGKIVRNSQRQLEAQLNCLERMINEMQSADKEVVLLSLGNIYREPILETDSLDYFTKLFLNSAEKITRADELFLLSDQESLSNYEKQLYLDRQNIQLTNDELEKVAIKTGIEFLMKQDYLCDEITVKCDVLTEDGKKIYFDSSHYTLDGAKHFGKKIYDLGWFSV